MKRGGVVTCVIWSSLGCAAAAVADASVENESSLAHDERRICDGSAGIRLALGSWIGGMPYPYTSVLSELGYDFLYVDGNCRYWAHAPQSAADEYHLWRPYREGTLTPADERRLHDAVSYDGPQAACPPKITVPDASQTFLWDGREFRSCADDGVDGSRPLRAELYAAATAVTGPMRIQVGENFYSDLDAPVFYEWPLGTSIDQFVLDSGEVRSFRVDDLEAAAALRALREQAIAAAKLSSGSLLVIAIGSPEGRYFMAVRDELPFVGADGFWRPDR